MQEYYPEPIKRIKVVSLNVKYSSAFASFDVCQAADKKYVQNYLNNTA